MHFLNVNNIRLHLIYIYYKIYPSGAPEISQIVFKCSCCTNFSFLNIRTIIKRHNQVQPYTKQAIHTRSCVLCVMFHTYTCLKQKKTNDNVSYYVLLLCTLKLKLKVMNIKRILIKLLFSNPFQIINQYLKIYLKNLKISSHDIL